MLYHIATRFCPWHDFCSDWRISIRVRTKEMAIEVKWRCKTWWRHQMETFSALLAICARNSPGTGEFPAQWPVTRSFDVSLIGALNKRSSKQWWGWWFETPSRSLWRHCNVTARDIWAPGFLGAESQVVVLSNFSYWPVTTIFCGSRNSIKLEKLQERALRIIYRDTTSTYEGLLKRGFFFTTVNIPVKIPSHWSVSII